MCSRICPHWRRASHAATDRSRTYLYNGTIWHPAIVWPHSGAVMLLMPLTLCVSHMCNVTLPHHAKHNATPTLCSTAVTGHRRNAHEMACREYATLSFSLPRSNVRWMSLRRRLCMHRRPAIVQLQPVTYLPASTGYRLLHDTGVFCPGGQSQWQHFLSLPCQRCHAPCGLVRRSDGTPPMHAHPASAHLFAAHAPPSLHDRLNAMARINKKTLLCFKG